MPSFDKDDAYVQSQSQTTPRNKVRNKDKAKDKVKMKDKEKGKQSEKTPMHLNPRAARAQQHVQVQTQQTQRSSSTASTPQHRQQHHHIVASPVANSPPTSPSPARSSTNRDELQRRNSLLQGSRSSQQQQQGQSQSQRRLKKVRPVRRSGDRMTISGVPLPTRQHGQHPSSPSSLSLPSPLASHLPSPHSSTSLTATNWSAHNLDQGIQQQRQQQQQQRLLVDDNCAGYNEVGDGDGNNFKSSSNTNQYQFQFPRRFSSNAVRNLHFPLHDSPQRLRRTFSNDDHNLPYSSSTALPSPSLETIMKPTAASKRTNRSPAAVNAAAGRGQGKKDGQSPLRSSVPVPTSRSRVSSPSYGGRDASQNKDRDGTTDRTAETSPRTENFDSATSANFSRRQLASLHQQQQQNNQQHQQQSHSSAQLRTHSSSPLPQPPPLPPTESEPSPVRRREVSANPVDATTAAATRSQPMPAPTPTTTTGATNTSTQGQTRPQASRHGSYATGSAHWRAHALLAQPHLRSQSVEKPPQQSQSQSQSQGQSQSQSQSPSPGPSTAAVIRSLNEAQNSVIVQQQQQIQRQSAQQQQQQVQMPSQAKQTQGRSSPQLELSVQPQQPSPKIQVQAPAPAPAQTTGSAKLTSRPDFPRNAKPGIGTGARSPGPLAAQSSPGSANPNSLPPSTSSTSDPTAASQTSTTDVATSTPTPPSTGAPANVAKSRRSSGEITSSPRSPSTPANISSKRQSGAATSTNAISTVGDGGASSGMGNTDLDGDPAANISSTGCTNNVPGEYLPAANPTASTAASAEPSELNNVAAPTAVTRGSPRNVLRMAPNAPLETVQEGVDISMSKSADAPGSGNEHDKDAESSTRPSVSLSSTTNKASIAEKESGSDSGGGGGGGNAGKSGGGSGSNAGGQQRLDSRRRNNNSQRTQSTNRRKPGDIISKRSFASLPPARGRSGDVAPRNMIVEAETVSSVPQVSLGVGQGDWDRNAPGRSESGGALRMKPSDETIRPKKEKKKAPKATRAVPAGTGASKADFFEYKVKTAVDEADSSDSAETFVYDSNPADAAVSRPTPRTTTTKPRYNSRTPSVTSLTSQADQYFGRSRGPTSAPAPNLSVKRSMKFANNNGYNYGSVMDVDDSPDANSGGGDGVGGGAISQRSANTSNSGSRANTRNGRGHLHGARHYRPNIRNNVYPSVLEPTPFFASTSGGSGGGNPKQARHNISNARRSISHLRGNGAGNSKNTRDAYGYDFDGEGADDERAPLLSSRPGRFRSHHHGYQQYGGRDGNSVGCGRRPNSASLRQLEYLEQRQRHWFARYAFCGLLLTGLFFLVALGTSIIVGLTKPLHGITVLGIENVIASEQEIIMDLNVQALNPNLLALTVSRVDINVFAKSKFIGLDGVWTDLVVHTDANDGAMGKRDISDEPPQPPPIRPLDSVDHGTDPMPPDFDPPAEPPADNSSTMLLGRVFHLDAPLTFDPSPWKQIPASTMGQIRLAHPGNKTEEDGTKRWEKVLQHPFELILRGVVQYQLPLGSRHTSAPVSGRVDVVPGNEKAQ